MKRLLLLLPLLYGSVAMAQAEGFAKPDFETIEKNIKDEKSPYNYQKLYARYQDADSTMTIEEKRHLYYGYSFTPGYAPYVSSGILAQLREILNKEDPSPADMKKIILYCGVALEQYPFSLRLKEYRIYCMKELGMIAEATHEKAQAAMIVDAILSTGDGITKDTPFYVVNTVNEYEVVHLLGFDYGGDQALMDHKFDYLSLSKNSYELPGLYFDVSRCLSTLQSAGTGTAALED